MDFPRYGMVYGVNYMGGKCTSFKGCLLEALYNTGEVWAVKYIMWYIVWCRVTSPYTIVYSVGW